MRGFVVLACTFGVTTAFVRSSGHARGRCLVKTDALKANDPKDRPRQRPKAKKPPIRRIDPALAMVPVPLVPDVRRFTQATVKA